MEAGGVREAGGNYPDTITVAEVRAQLALMLANMRDERLAEMDADYLARINRTPKATIKAMLEAEIARRRARG